jgi:iron complex outermembrane receptor protein
MALNWAQRLKRVFAIDIETCLECGGNLSLIACTEEPWLIGKILRHVQQRNDLADSDARGPPGFALTSVTAFEDADALTNGDSDGGPLNILAFGQVSDTSQWSQELRLASASDSAVRWIGGLYYFHEDADWGTFLRLTPPPVYAANGGPLNDGPQAVANNVTSQKDEVWSAYGQGEFSLSNAFSLTLGLRYTSETKQADVAAAFGTWTPAIFPADRPMGFKELALVNGGVSPALARVDKTWDEVGGKLTLDYHQSDDVLLYGSIARGFKGGGTSLAAIEGITGNPGRVIDPETLWSYELGAKTSWLDNRVNLNLAVFYNDWKDQQLFTAVVSPDLAGTYLINVPESRSYGAELELQWRPAEGWYVAGGLALLNAELKKTTPEYPNLVEGNTLPNSPDLSFNGLLRREWDLAGGLLALQSTFSYKDDVQYDIAENPIFHEDSFWLVNVRASYGFGANREYEVAIFGNNLTDTEYCMQRTDNVNVSAFSGTGRCTGNPGEAIYGVTARVEF